MSQNKNLNNAITPRNINFTKWYDDVLQAADLIHYGLVKGSIIYTANGTTIWENIKQRLNQILMQHGVKNMMLPTLIPYSAFALEKKHLEGFAPEMFIVTKTAVKSAELVDPLVLRPTSEIPFCSYFKDTLISYNQLPMKFNQWANVFRVEKNTRPFLRNSEFHWQEMHSIHQDQTEAMNFILTINNAYKTFIENYLMIPVLNGKKTENERFAGAEKTYTCEALMQDGQALQCATSHYLAQNFTKPYEIFFRNKQNELQNPHQTSAGISTRIIGAIIMTHSDDLGLVLPWNIAIEQIVICPLKNTPEINAYMQEIATLISHYRYQIDTSNNSMGKKIKQAQTLGVPLTILVGLNEVQNRQLTILWRNENDKRTVHFDYLQNELSNASKNYDQSLYEKAKARLEASIIVCHTLEEVAAAINDKKIALAPWGGDANDEIRFRKQTTFSPRCIKEAIDSDEDLVCFYTKKKANSWVYFAKAY